MPTPTERELSRLTVKAGLSYDVEWVSTSCGPRYAFVCTWGTGDVVGFIGRTRQEARAYIAELQAFRKSCLSQG